MWSTKMPAKLVTSEFAGKSYSPPASLARRNYSNCLASAALLREQGIDVVYDNAGVGENLQDHIRAGISFEDTRLAAGPFGSTSREELYKVGRSGPWAEMAVYMFAYMPLARLTPAADMEELEAECRKHLDSNDDDLSPLERKHNAFIRNTLFASGEASATAYLIRKNVAPVPGPELEAGKCITFCAMLSHPLSKGSVHIESPSTSEKPAINFNYYKHPFDLEVHARHKLALQTLAQNPASYPMIKRNGARYPPELDLNTA